MTSAQLERNKTREQIEEEKKISLSFRIKPLNIEGFTVQKLQFKATELWDQIIKLETEKYDLEERQKRQDYDVSNTYAKLYRYIKLYFKLPDIAGRNVLVSYVDSHNNLCLGFS